MNKHKRKMIRIRPQSPPERTDHPDHRRSGGGRWFRSIIKIPYVVAAMLLGSHQSSNKNCNAFTILSPHYISTSGRMHSTHRAQYHRYDAVKATGRTRRQLLMAKSSGGSIKNNRNIQNKSSKGFGSTTSTTGTSSTSQSSSAASRTAPTSGTATQQQQTPPPLTSMPPPAALAAPVASKRDREVMLQQLQKQYGGTSPSEIAAGTQRKMSEYKRRSSCIRNYNSTIQPFPNYPSINKPPCLMPNK